MSLQIPIDDARCARLDAAIDKAVHARTIVGAVVMAMQDGRLLYRRAAGMADREREVPVRFDTVFRLASMTKMMVSATALSMWEDGKLDLEASATRWLPEFRPCLADGSRPVITVRHLLTHTAGLSYGFEQGEQNRYAAFGISDGLDLPEWDLYENIRRLAKAPLFFRPGSAWQYSLATDVLGAVLERASSRPLPEIVADRVTRPLGMNDTGFTAGDSARIATPYADGIREPVRMLERTTVPLDTGMLVLSPGRALHAHAYPSGGAGMVGTCADYMAFLEAIRRGGQGILRRDTAAMMVSNAIGTVSVPSRGAGWGFGLGPLVLTDAQAAGSMQGTGTWLWGGVYGGHFWVDPVAQITLVALSNTAIAGLWGTFPDSLVEALMETGMRKTVRIERTA